jgi:hypothetical protein
MAVLARELLDEALHKFDSADALAAEMESDLKRVYSSSAIYAYAPGRQGVPPGDVLLAAARAGGISLDEKLGIRREASAIDELRGQVESLREQVESLMSGQGVSTAPTAAEARRRERREWASQAAAQQTSAQAPVVNRRDGRRRRP